MRIVHDIDEKATASVGGTLYLVERGKSKSRGFRASVLIIAGEDEIHMEGDGAYILDVLKDVVSQLEDCGEMFCRKGKLAKRWVSKVEE